MTSKEQQAAENAVLGADNPAIQISKDLQGYKQMDIECTLAELPNLKKFWVDQIKLKRNELRINSLHPIFSRL